MKTDDPSNDRDREATAPPGGMATRDESQSTGRLNLAVFVVAELLCTGALIAWVLQLRVDTAALAPGSQRESPERLPSTHRRASGDA